MDKVMRKIFSIFTTSVLSLALVACGGGDGSAFGTPAPGGSTQVATSIVMTTSAATVPSDGTGSAVITALVRDANNTAMANMPVVFSTSAGSLVVTQATTDTSGEAKATLTASGAATGTTMTVTATSGGVSQTVNVAVANTQQTISVTPSTFQMPSDGSVPVKITALVRGASNQLLPGVKVSFAATSGGIAVTNDVTDASGAVVAQLTPAGDPTNRRITVTATAGTSSASTDVDVIGTIVTITGSTNLVLGAVSSYDIAVLDSSGVGLSGKAVTVASSALNGLSSTNLTTDQTGHVAVALTASVAGSDTLTATALGKTGTPRRVDQ